VNESDNLMVFLLTAVAACVLVLLLDAWVWRPRRDPAASSLTDPWLPKSAAYAVAALSLIVLWQLFRHEAVDFSLMLVDVGAGAGIIWAVDHWFFARRRLAAAMAAGTAPGQVREPVAVEYARSFFPVIVLVLLIRSFVFEPFRIPSDLCSTGTLFLSASSPMDCACR
jgi:hypothetical protein